MTPHATPADTIAALRTRYTGELAVADKASKGPWFAKPDADGKPGMLITTGTRAQRHAVLGRNDYGHGDAICFVKEIHLDGNARWHNREFIIAARESVPRDARLKLALLDQVERALCRAEQADIDAAAAVGLDEVAARVHVAYKTEERVALATLRLLAESAGEAVAW